MRSTTKTKKKKLSDGNHLTAGAADVERTLHQVPGGDLFSTRILSFSSQIFKRLAALPIDEKVRLINEIRAELHKYSPFASEPVDFVRWIPAEEIIANDYNPNAVAPPEMELLKLSILEDGYTQPIVTFKHDEKREVVDGFHRNRVGRECPEIKDRVKGYLPVVTINEGRSDRGDRITSTIRHNRARGKHRVDAMADIVVELKHRNWSDEKIAKNLGMDSDEVLRLCQITGMAGAFGDADFSKSWDIGFEENLDEIKFEDDTDEVS